MDQGSVYEVEISILAGNRYRDEVLTYLVNNFSYKRVIEIDNNIMFTLNSLSTFPKSGRIVEELVQFEREFRFKLHKETRNVEVKIIYYIIEEIKKVIVTDIFPTPKNHRSLSSRS